MIGTYLTEEPVYSSTEELEQHAYHMNTTLKTGKTRWGTPVLPAVELRVRETLRLVNNELARRRATK